MTRTRLAWLTGVAWCELARYDVVHGVAGRPQLVLPPVAGSVRTQRASGDDIHRALTLACALYFKPVRCLQGSVCLARLLRRRGVDAHVVIGYRTRPFMSHAWVEANGRVVNDSQAYRQRLQVLCIL